ncbi:MAG: undecaprenyl-diphosphate phosphatase [Oscillospiraceae bacterium]|nr:undecaprenyl-diphosphate phosphatase [Oscillospiraceae bacterium]
MTVIKAIILGLIQGLTEFLPVSSSGHLAIAGRIMGMDPEADSLLSFNILLHVATLAAVFIVYRQDIFLMIKAFFSMLGDLFTGKGLGLGKDMYRRLVIMLIVGTLPAVAAAVLFGDIIEDPALWLIGIFLIITAVLLFVSDRVGKGKKTMEGMGCKEALVVGCFQALGTLPGISRSGSTIVGGLFAGLDKTVAVRFSFLLSIPAILGALVLDVKDLFGGVSVLPSAPCVIAGMLVAGLSGYFAIRFMLGIVRRQKLSLFSAYCVLAGAAAIILNFTL